MDSAVADIPTLPVKLHNNLHSSFDKVCGFIYQDSIIQIISPENIGKEDKTLVIDFKSKKSSLVQIKNFPQYRTSNYSISWVDSQTLFLYGCYQKWNGAASCWSLLSGYLDLSNFAATKEWTTECFKSAASCGLAPCGRENHNAQIIGSSMYVFGGCTPEDFWRLDLETLEWKQISFKLPNPVGKIYNKSLLINNTILCFAEGTPIIHRKYLLAIKIREDEITLKVKETKEQISFQKPPHTLVPYNDQLFHIWKYSHYSSPLEEVISLEELNEPIHQDSKSQKREYFEKRPSPDVIFKCKDQEISAHKGIISPRCPFLGELLHNEDGKPIELKDISADVFLLVLEWIYCNEIRGLMKKSGEVVEDLLVAADAFKLPEVIEMAQRCLVGGLTVENFIKRAKILKGLAGQECKDLEKGIVNLIAKDLDAVFKRDDVMEIQKEIIYQVLQQKMNSSLCNNCGKKK